MAARRHGACAPYHPSTRAPWLALAFLLGLSAAILGASALAAAAPAASLPLQVSSYASPGNGTAPLNVYFQGNVSGGTGNYRAIQWTFGDGVVAGGVSVRHTYELAGNYTVTLEVTDSAGTSAWANLTVRVATVGASKLPNQNPPAGPGPSVLLSFVVGATLGAAAAASGTLAFWRIRTARAGSRLSANPSQGESLSPPRPRTLGPSAPTSTRAGSAALTLPSNEPRRISEEVVVHLQSLGRLSSDELVDPLRTQPGMVARLDVPQNVISPVLRRLTDAGVVRTELRHVRGRSRRLKVYALTDRGDALAREVRLRRATHPVGPGPRVARPVPPASKSEDQTPG